MPELARWIRLAAGLLLLASPFLPQTDAGASVILLREIAADSAPVEWLGCWVWLFLPLAAGGLLAAASRRREGAGPLLRAVTLALLFLLAFALATLGSLALTDPGADPRFAAPSFPLSLLLFTLPLVLAGTAVARLLGGDFSRSTGGFVRFSLGLLVALYGFQLADNGWDFVGFWAGHRGGLRLLASAWVAPAAGLLAAAAELAARIRPRVAVDTAPASG